MTRIPDKFLKTVFFIYPSEYDAVNGSEAGATGFFFQEPSAFNKNLGYSYAVTNAHVIFGNGIETPILRINSKNGEFRLIPTQRDKWIRHPNGDDLAIYPISLSSDFSIISFKRKEIIDKTFIEKFNIGPGDEVVMAGRFRVHAGKKKNLPILCSGIIAAMNDEPLRNPFTQLQQESFLVEMRSIAGFSGSPVLVYIPPVSFRFKENNNEIEELYPTHHRRLLGIEWGHIKHSVKGNDVSGQEIIIEMDSAMAGVVPGWKLLEIIDIEDLLLERKKKDDLLLKRKAEINTLTTRISEIKKKIDVSIEKGDDINSDQNLRSEILNIENEIKKLENGETTVEWIF